MPNLPTSRRGLTGEDLILGAIALLTIGTFFLIAGSIGSDLGKRRPADAYYNRLVAGFQAGQLHLRIDTPPGLAALPDPYDPKANRSHRLTPDGEPGMLHDLSYYRGKLHLYFGVTPAIILFWPFHLLTGGWLSHQFAAAVFASLGFLLSLGLLRLVRHRHFPHASAFTVACSALALGLGSGLPLTLNRPDIWEVPILCGYALVMLTLLLLWFACTRPGQRGRFLALASLAYGLALGSRPSLLLGAAVLLLPLLPERRAPFRRLAALALAAVGPITLLGLALLAYNHLRFGSPFEFGQRYQLAGVRVDTLRLFSPSYLPFNLHAYFLHLPPWPGALPARGFLRTSALPTGHGGIESAFGILTCLPFVARGLPEETRSGFLPFAAATAGLALASALILSCFCGVCLRYESEFGPALLLLAGFGALACDHRLSAHRPGRLALRAATGALLLHGLAFTAIHGIALRAQTLSRMFNERALFLATQPGRRDEAIRTFEQAVHQSPRSPIIRFNLALGLLEAGRSAEALAQFETALQLDPNFTPARQVLEQLRPAVRK
jgi:tetratricopeptide (TPR) repeat protein